MELLPIIEIDSVKRRSYKEYSKKIPAEVANLESINKIKPLRNSIGEVYFLYPGGGVLFQYKNDAIERIDNSFPHRNQFSGHFFSYKNEIYLLGGYGYWKSNSILTKFNFTSKEWDFVETFGSAPKLGINDGSFVLDNGILYVFDFIKKLKMLTIKMMIFLNDSKTLTWSREGLNQLFMTISRKTFEVNIPYGTNKYLHKHFNSDEFLIMDVKNLVSTYSSPDLNIIRDNAIMVGSKIIYSRFLETEVLKP